MPKTFQELMPQIVRIVHDAIQDGLLRGEKLKTFRKKVKTLQGKELEDYIQTLWDRI